MVLGSHQDVIGQLEVTDKVVVLIGIYIYYYYDSGHSELTNGWAPEKENAAGQLPAAFCGRIVGDGYRV